MSTRVITKRREDANNSAEKANCEMKWTTQASSWKNMPLLIFFAKTYLYMYNSLQFAAEMISRSSETPTTLTPFHINYD